MFGGNFWGSPTGNEDYLSRERDPPPRPIELEFPEYVPLFRPQPLTSKLSSELRHKICHSRTFLDTSTTDIESLNVNFKKDVTISSLLPKDQFTDRPLLFDDDLQAMIDEISIDNEDAFREVLRMPPLPGRNKPRIAYARNFFGSLEDMARYFDDSKDDYYRVPVDKDSKKGELKPKLPSEGLAKDAKMEDLSDSTSSQHDLATKEVYQGYRISSAESLSPGTRLALLKNLLKTTMHKFQCRDHEPIPHPREKLVLRGVKVQSIQYQFCVARVPQEVKLARARKVEGPIMAVVARDELRFKERTGLENPEKMLFMGERFDLFKEIGCMLILAAQRARQGKESPASSNDHWWVSKPRWGGGPTTWGQLAHEIYEDEDPSWSPEERRLQEEKKQRQAEDKAKSIEDKVDPKQLNVDDLIAHTTIAQRTRSIHALPGIPAGATTATAGSIVVPTELDLRPRRKKLRSMDRPSGSEAVTRDGRRVMYTPPFKERWYQEWQRLRPNTSMIDDKIIWKRIGAPSADTDAFDEVYLLTGVNHHVALVKMKVHPAYLAWLDKGTEVPDEAVADEMKRNALHVSRTSWFDMFKVEDRREFLIGLWRLFCYINRDYVPKAEYEKMEALRTQGSP